MLQSQLLVKKKEQDIKGEYLKRVTTEMAIPRKQWGMDK